jgi:hypothetical protein
VFEPVLTHSRPTFTFDFLITADLFITIQETFMKLTSLVAAWRALPWRARPEDRHHHGHVSLYADIDGQAAARILSGTMQDFGKQVLGRGRGAER